MKNVIHIFGASGSGTTMARLCLSAFARVATRIFSAGAASCASLPQRIRAGCDFFSLQNRISLSTLPQRIRAGCDCGKAMQRTANLLREGR